MSFLLVACDDALKLEGIKNQTVEIESTYDLLKDVQVKGKNSSNYSIVLDDQQLKTNKEGTYPVYYHVIDHKGETVLIKYSQVTLVHSKQTKDILDFIQTLDSSFLTKKFVALNLELELRTIHMAPNPLGVDVINPKIAMSLFLISMLDGEILIYTKAF